MIRTSSFLRSARTGPARRYKDLVFWACEGLVVCQDERPGYKGKGDYKVIKPNELKDRITNIVDSTRRVHKGADAPRWQKQRNREEVALLQGVDACVEEAKRMGDPSSPAVQAFWSRHRPGSKSTISLKGGGYIDPEGYPEFAPLPLGRDTGRTTGDPDKSVAALLNNPRIANAMTLHRPPTRKRLSPIVLEL